MESDKPSEDEPASKESSPGERSGIFTNCGEQENRADTTRDCSGQESKEVTHAVRGWTLRCRESAHGHPRQRSVNTPARPDKGGIGPNSTSGTQRKTAEGADWIPGKRFCSDTAEMEGTATPLRTQRHQGNRSRGLHQRRRTRRQLG